MSSEQIVETLRKAIAEKFGLSEEEVMKTLKIEPRLDVDEKRVKELVDRGEATLPEGARIVGKIVWNVATNELR